MELTVLKNSDLKVSKLCFGGCPMGGHGWGDVAREELVRAVQHALELGVNFFDTADVYGLGESERTLGEALGGKRDAAVIATKFGVRRDANGTTYYDNSPGWIREAAEASLKRLGTDYIDLYQLHYRDHNTPVGEVVEALEQLKEKGWIRHYGLSNVYQSDLAELKGCQGKFVSFQNEFSLANRMHEQDIQYLTDHLQMTALTWGSLGQGILSGKYDENVKFDKSDRRSREIYTNFHGEKLRHNLRIVSYMKEIAEETGRPVPAIAIRWILDYLKDSCVIVGIKTIKQLEMNVLALGWELPDQYVKGLNDISDAKEVQV